MNVRVGKTGWRGWKIIKLNETDMKGFYITYGVFIQEIEKVVKELEIELRINLIKNGYAEDNEIYYLDESSKCNINHFSILYGNLSGYYLNEFEHLYPNYLISCNIILEQNEKLEDIQQIRNISQALTSTILLDFNL